MCRAKYQNTMELGRNFSLAIILLNDKIRNISTQLVYRAVLQFNTSAIVHSDLPSKPPHFKYYRFTQKPGFKHRFQTSSRQLDMFKRILCNVIPDVSSDQVVTRCTLFDRLADKVVPEYMSNTT